LLERETAHGHHNRFGQTFTTVAHRYPPQNQRTTDPEHVRPVPSAPLKRYYRRRGPATSQRRSPGLRQVIRTPGGDFASALFDAPRYGRQEGRIARGAADARCAGGRTTRGPRGCDHEEGRIARFPFQVSPCHGPGGSLRLCLSPRSPSAALIRVRRGRASRERGRQKPRSSHAPAQARSKKVKVTRAQGRVAVSPGQVQSCRTVGSMRPGREQRCRRSVRSLPDPGRTSLGIPPPRPHDTRLPTHRRGAVRISGTVSAAGLDAGRAGARRLSPGADADRWGARLISSGTEHA
jgi:hypothetical protein